MRLFLVRWCLALVAVTCGWALNFVVYISIAAASPTDQYAWAVWTGLLCVAAWFLVGLPLAAAGPDLSSGSRIATATVLCGLGAVLMIATLFRSLAAAFSIFALLAFITGSASMLVYAALCRSLQRT